MIYMYPTGDHSWELNSRHSLNECGPAREAGSGGGGFGGG